MRTPLILTLVMLTGCTTQTEVKKEAPMSELQQKIARFSPTPIGVEAATLAKLSPEDRQALAKMVEAAKLLDPLFRRQVWAGNEALAAKLKPGSPEAHYFRINQGPWSRLDHNEPFIPGVPAKPAGAGFYPEDMTKAEFEQWQSANQTAAQSYFTVIARQPDKSLKAIPYSEAYREFLTPAAKLLREAAALTKNATLKRFLTLRADAFGTDDYYASDVAWMDVNAPIDITIGPYETYEDELFGYKAAFEAYVGLRDDAESAKLGRFSGYLQELENHLPFDRKYRNPKLGAAAPIRVIDVVFTSGDGNRGVQTAAYNLPNDERVIKEKGSKRVMLKNVQQAKFAKTLVPISQILLSPEDQAHVSFDAFFTHVLAHELMHGLGPHNIQLEGKATTVRLALKDLYSAIEEAKADTTGLWALSYLMKTGKLDPVEKKRYYLTYLASMFRSVRFGINEAHGKGVALQFNYLLEHGAISVRPEGYFTVDVARFDEAVTQLTGLLLTLEAEGNYDKARGLLTEYAALKPQLQGALDRLKSLPVDIEPQFTPIP